MLTLVVTEKTVIKGLKKSQSRLARGLKAWFRGRLLAGIRSSNLAGGVDVYRLRMFCVL